MLMLNMESIRGVINKLYLFRPFIRYHYGMSERNLFCSALTQKAQGDKKELFGKETEAFHSCFLSKGCRDSLNVNGARGARFMI